LLLRATALLPPLDPERLGLFPDLGEALLQVGEVARAESLLDDAAAAAELAGEPALAATIDVVRMLVRRFTSADPNWTEQALQTATAAVAAAERSGEDAAAARAWRLVASIRGNACRHEEGVEAIEAALLHARRAGDARQERRSATVYALLLAYGPTPVPEAIARCEALAPRVAGDRQSEAALLCVLGHLHALDGDFETARDLMRTSRALFEELGLRVDAAVLSIQASHVEFLADDPAAAEAELRRGFEVLDPLGDRYWLPSIAGLLAQAAYGQGRLDEARRFSAVAEARARLDDVDAQALWRSVRAKVLARGDDVEVGERLAREAVELLRPTDAVLFRISAAADLAEVLAAAGRADEAAAELKRAVALADRKRSAPLAARLRALAAVPPFARL